jgi:hypothetical protein
MNMKKTLLTLLIAGVGCSFSVNAQQAPEWQDVPDNPKVIEVHENNQWIRYRQNDTPCPTTPHLNRTHREYGNWQGHQHHREGRQPQVQNGAHASGRTVKYQRKQNGEIVDGVMNVMEKDGKCLQYVRTSNTSSASERDKEVIIKMQQDLEVD